MFFICVFWRDCGRTAILLQLDILTTIVCEPACLVCCVEFFLAEGSLYHAVWEFSSFRVSIALCSL
ncbi:hypothetical protein KC19_4G061800 [Ceratodon purpureus]|uniref:Secreted protein n=1 Tax=Ceratodon purpureus TaxID=3225 RepID=A0A8T0I7I4_CERPU|nr:hypothetical protein KC19_4G061800 [Ceratodon purpureus]